MGCERFDVGIKRDAGEMILTEGQGAIEIENDKVAVSRENAKSARPYIRSAGARTVSLLDLYPQMIERMKAEGFERTVIVKISPNNFQA